MVLEHNDSVKEAPAPSSERGLPHIDRMELLQDHSKLNSTPNTAQLHEFNITDDSAAAKNLKDNPSGAKLEDGVDKKTGSDDKTGVEQPQTEIVKTTGKDPKAPTVAFLDEFKQKDTNLGDGTFVAHGEISRAAAEANGFNTIALQNSDKRDQNNDMDFGQRLNDIGKKIDAGQLKLGRGDVLNVSVGNNDPTFEQANQFLGFSGDKAITPENLAANKDAILSRMKEISQDPTRSEADRATAQRVVGTNQAIDDLKARGIEVVHAAGNDTANRFSWDFMNSSAELSSNKPSGKADDFSANHSLTTPGDGVVPIHVRNEANLFSPTPIANQKGNLEIGDTGAKFERTGRDIFPADSQIFNRENFQLGRRMDYAKVEPKPLDSSLFDATPIDQRTISGASLPTNDFGASILPSDRFSGAVPFPKKFDLARPGQDLSAQALQPGEVPVEGLITGTSFSNIKYLKSEYERLRALKE